MPDKLTFKLLSSENSHSDFDWMNIDREGTRVGKVRGLVNGKGLTIHSINIFPDFEGRNYGRQTIEMFKGDFHLIIGNRVPPAALAFWEKMGFVPERGENYMYQKEEHII